MRFLRNWLIGLSLALIVAGALSSYGGKNQLRWNAPAAPPAWEARATAHGTVAVSTARPLARSVPRFIWIPAIRVWARIEARGLRPNGTAVLPSLNHPFVTTWFDRGPAPGQRGTAAIFGHVDSYKVGPAVFYKLGVLRPGDLVYITLDDQQVAIFRVYALAMYQKSAFPTAVVYRYTQWPTLRLITCGGPFDQRSHHYLSNVVAFAVYVGARR
ncbi:MAG TPA: sortase [Streptosporangiaceae bacterium]|nr:sortase [Streptosporangiaceae bacterium]